MSNCIIYTFSGTGNSLYVANFLKQKLDQLGVETTIYNIRYPIDKDLVPSPNDFDYVGFSYPIHGFNAPKPFVDFVKMLPPSAIKGKKYFIAKNSGEPFFANNSSSALTAKILKKKGYVLTLEHHFLMPYNIMFNYPQGLIKSMYVYSNAMSELFAKEVLDDHELFRIKHSAISRMISFFIRIEWIAGPINSKLCFVKKKKCTECGVCLKSCPTNSLYINKKGKIKMHSSCAICMACAFNCPQDAFYMGILNPWRVNFGGFKYKKLLADPSIEFPYVNDQTKGYFKLFKKYYKKQDTLLKEAGIDIKNYL